MKCLSIDDNPVDLRLIRALIKEDSRLELMGEYLNPVDGLLAIQKLKPDVIFLDYRFSNYNADEIMSSSVYKPKIILVTSHSNDYRLSLIENVIKILHKPIDSLDFMLAVNKFMDEQNNNSPNLNTLS